MKAFYEQFSKSGKFELILVGCDKREKEFAEHLKDYDWCYALPFEAPDVLVGALEEAANAENIPRLSIFSTARGFDKPVVADVKGIILRN